MRTEWDQYFMDLAIHVATRSTCIRRHVGAVAVKNRRVLATGYNGAPAGFIHCEEIGCIRNKLNIPSGQRHELCRAVHAEQNVVAQAARFGVSLEGCTLYCTVYPCNICAKLLANTGIDEIVVSGSYPDPDAKTTLEQAHITVIRI